jgi:hypothetical protein
MIFKFIAAHNLLAAVENGRFGPQAGRAASQFKPEGSGLGANSPTGCRRFVVGAREVDPPSCKAANYERTGRRWQSKKHVLEIFT